jgi:hypothetical protein
MADYKKLTVAVIDNGLFTALAETLTRYFGRVLYWTPWISVMPKSNRRMIGKGIPGVERIDSFWPMLGEIDLFIFADVGFGPLQVHLESLGKRVWGSRLGEELELDRVASKRHMKSLGIDIGKYYVINGFDALREHLKKHNDSYIKVSLIRGDCETFKATNYRLIEPYLNELEHKLGALKTQLEFVVEEAIPDAIEVGYDGFTIDGKFPQSCTSGIEIKDKGFVMHARRYADIAPQLRKVNDLLEGTLSHYRYRGFLSTEVRITRDGHGYVIDPTTRSPSPPSQLYWEIIKNWGDIFWEGADGTIVEPEFTAEWGAELMLWDLEADRMWLPVDFPKAIQDQVKLSRYAMLNGRPYVIPQDCEIQVIGAVVGTGDSMEAAIKSCQVAAEQIEAFGLEIKIEALDEAQSELDKLKEFGIEL